VDRQEIRFLEHRNELSSLALTNDSAMIKFEVWVEDKLIRFSDRFRQVCIYASHVVFTRLQEDRAGIEAPRRIPMSTSTQGQSSGGLPGR
jgi:hypothetical protein